MIRTLQSLTMVSGLILVCILSSATVVAADSEETLPTPEPTRATDNTSVRPVTAPRKVIIYQTYRYRAVPRYRSPVQVYRNGKYGRYFGDFYGDRNGGFFYGYDSRYRFGIHR